MAKYIDAELLIENLKKQYGEDLGWQCTVNMSDVGMMIEDAPTADVVEVCRCHECKYGDNGIQKQEVYTACNRFGNGILKMSPLDFCSYGERRTDNDV
jgi:hypothetical protein